MMDKKRGSFTSRDLALVAGLSGLFIAYGYVSSVTLRNVTRSLDLFFLISVLFTILTIMTHRIWSATLLGTITGLVFLGTPAPFAAHITISLIANGLVFDLYTRLAGSNESRYEGSRMVVAGSSGNLTMAAVGLALIQLVGIPLPVFPGVSSPVIVWVIVLVSDTFVGALGALFGTVVVERVEGRVKPPLIR